MKAKRLYSTDQLVNQPLPKALSAIGQMFDTLFSVINRLSPGALKTNTQAGVLDGVWLVAVFTGTSDQTFTHSLGRPPAYFLEAFPLLPPGETRGVYGEVQMTAATSTTVTLRCQTSGKTARIILM